MDNSAAPFLSIVIPFHNERDNLQVLLPQLDDQLQTLNHDIEIILVDDQSADESYAFAKGFAEDRGPWSVISLPKRGGQTGCYRAAFEKANGRFILRMDADLQDDPKDLPLFIDKLECGAELVMGLRECRQHRRLLRIASLLYDLLIISLFDTPLHSNSGSYVAFRSELVKDIPWRKNDHRYLPLIAIHRKAKNVSEVIVRHRERKFGETKYNPLRKVFLGVPEVISFIFRLKRGVYDLANPVAHMPSFIEASASEDKEFPSKESKRNPQSQ